MGTTGARKEDARKLKDDEARSMYGYTGALCTNSRDDLERERMEGPAPGTQVGFTADTAPLIPAALSLNFASVWQGLAR
jgi:hypothetical protein